MKSTVDLAALVGTIAAILHWMPDLAGLVGFIWYCIRIYEYFKNKNHK